MGIVLIGYRGSGKSTIGPILADRLWQKFVDTDDRVVALAGKPIREIFEKEGENHFRDLESTALAEALKLEDTVIAVGGGALGRIENRQLLQNSGHKIIYLRCDLQELARRIAADPTTGASRPSLTDLGGGIEEITKMIQEREPIYRQTMTAELDVTNLTPKEAVVYIVRLL